MKRATLLALGTLMLAGMLAGSAPLADDILCLKDGRIVSGKKMSRTNGGIDIEYENGIVFVPAALILDAVLAEDLDVAPKTDEERQQTSKGFVRFEGKWITAAQRDDMLKKRVLAHQKELEEVRSHAEWRNRYKEDSKVFHYEYTVPQFIFERYRDAMEAYYAEFSRVWRVKAPSSEPKLPVNLYGDEAAFHQVGGVGPGVLAYFKYVKPWDLDAYYERLDPRKSFHVLFHEANHYLQQLIDLHFAMPHFPGESLAEYYGASDWDPEKKKFTIGLVQEGRLSEVQTDIAAGNMMSIDKLITSEEMYEHYTWGWSLVHFLMNDSRYTARFQKFVLALPNGKGIKREEMYVDSLRTISQEDVLPIFVREMGLKDATGLHKLEAEWHDYIERNLKIVTTSGLELAGMAAAESKPPRPIRAKRLFQEAIDKGSTNPLVYHRFAELQRFDNNWDAAIELWKKALELDPLVGKFYSRIGHTLVIRGDKEEGERWKALGIELGYDDIWADVDMGDADDGGGSGGTDSPEPPKPKKPGGKEPPKGPDDRE